MQLSVIKEVAEHNSQYFEDRVILLDKIQDGKVLSKERMDNGNIIPDNQEYTISKYAMSQMLERLKIRPIITGLEKWFTSEDTINVNDTVRTRDDLVHDIINLAVRRYGSEQNIIVDTSNAEIKGVVGSRYHRVPNLLSLEASLDVYGTDIDPRFSYIGDKQMSICFKSSEIKQSHVVGEKVGFGYTIGNSETGWASLSVEQFWLIVRCTNGMIGTNNIANTRIYHTSEEIVSRFQEAMKKVANDFSILDKIDNWATRPAFIENVDTDENKERFFGILNDKGISGKEQQEGILKAFNDQQEQHILNGYWIGNAVNYYASHNVQEAELAQQLLTPAYQIMQM